MIRNTRVCRPQILRKIRQRTDLEGARAQGGRAHRATSSVGRIARRGSPRSMEGSSQMQGRRLVPVLILASLLVTACEWMETAENVYATFEDAVKAGAVGDEKWIPELLLPPS